MKVSLELCLTKITNRSHTISSIKLRPILFQLNTSNQSPTLLQCDAVNRAHSAEWLSYTLLQVGDMPGSESIITDLYLADNQRTDNSSTYIQHAYVSRTRMLVELFHWFPYTPEFIDVSQRLYKLDQGRSLYMASMNDTDWFPSWCEAAYRLGK